jgi:aspartate kinase
LKILVQKFGGTSVSTEERRAKAAAKVLGAVKENYAVVVVVSAMGRRGDPYATDTLIQLAADINRETAARELDLLMSCGEVISGAVLAATLQGYGLRTALLTGGQAGIITNADYGEARILRVDPQEIYRELEAGCVVVVTGFQGATEDGQVTTLGRGGSDTTAAALGVALNAEAVDIYTDVEGIMTADPRLVQDARILDVVTYNDIAQLAHEGAKVIHPRAVEIAMRQNIPLRIKSTFSDTPGTLVTNSQPHRAAGADMFDDRLITGIAHMPQVTQFTIDISREADKPKVVRRIFKSMAQAGISVDFISTQLDTVRYTVKDELADKAADILQSMNTEAKQLPGCAIISLVGGGITDVPGVMADVAEVLAEGDIEILQSADSHTTIWVLVAGPRLAEAVRMLHDKFINPSGR